MVGSATSDTELRAEFEDARQKVVADPGSAHAARRLREAVARLIAGLTIRSPEPIQVDPAVAEADRRLRIGDDERAEIILRRHLAANSSDTSAMHLMALIALEHDYFSNAMKILQRATQIEPANAYLWAALGKVFYQIAAKTDQRELVDRALAAVDQALAIDSEFELALSLKASILVQQRKLEEAEQISQQLLHLNPVNSDAWTNHAYYLNVVGRLGESIAAHRVATAADPTNGEAWWGLANLKLVRLHAEDIQAMEEALVVKELEGLARSQIHFALGKAYTDSKNFAEAAKHLEAGNALRREVYPHDRATAAQALDGAIATFSQAFFDRRAGWGSKANDPIFVVGMPRSGSTLVEQILASHSMVEGTEELFAVQQIVGELEAAGGFQRNIVEELTAEQCEHLGERYLEITRFFRNTPALRFIDKNPVNWHYVGFINVILPNAKIVDVRRNPLDCCFANYSQYFHRLMDFAHDQTDLAHEYTNYVRLMRHFDAVLPGRVHRIIYEDLVDDLEGQVRGLLDYLELPFEESCLRFFETDRAVHTASSQQVRQPINRSGIGRWRNFEPWLSELKQALGNTLDDWRS